jgi:ABC-2 type transport system ATP-binding protein
MPVDRPRRALPDEPDDVESYVAKRSRGFTQADDGDRIVVRPARAARALEPSAVRTQTHTADRDPLGISDPSRPRRALPAEPMSWTLDEEEPPPTEARTAGRRAIVDLEPRQSNQPVLPSQPSQLAAAPPAPLEGPQPRRSAPSPHPEPAVELPKITTQQVRPPDPVPVPVQPATPITAPVPRAAPQEQTQLYRPAPPVDRPAVSRPQTPPVAGPIPQIKPAEPVRPASTVTAPVRPASRVTAPVRPASTVTAPVRPASTVTAPVRPASTVTARNRPASPVTAPDRPATTLRPESRQTIQRAAVRAGGRVRSSRPAVHHQVPPIIVDRLIKSYNGNLAVHNLSFMVEPGRVTGFLGPNGAGKTTTMRILVGLVTPTTGTATFGDLAYADLPHPQQTVGCVLDARFHPGRSGRNHLRVLAPTAGASDRRVDELLGEVGLGEVARQPVGEYSMGMQQRLALAAAMLGDPDYLILDEPANGIDPEGIRWLRIFLRDFAESGRAVLISSHLLNEIEATADDIVVINRGRLLAQMPMSELNLGEGITRARVPDLRAALQALAAIGAQMETAVDERGAYLRVHSHDVGQVGAALFSSGIVVDELVTERRDLEQEFFSMLEGSR